MSNYSISLLFSLLFAACAQDPIEDPPPLPDAAAADLTLHFSNDLHPPCDDPSPCHCDPDCHVFSLGAPLPLSTDMPPDPRTSSSGIGRDKSGHLTLDYANPSYSFGWVANSTDWGRGTVSKVNDGSTREVARYLTVTCSSLKTGSPALCDGMTGCCSLDDAPRLAARLANDPDPGHQAIQRDANFPSRTAVDFNGDLWVENRAPGGQPSVTKIANDVADCIDRNKNGRIDTSRDSNGDGLIETDCNLDGLPDDIASVTVKHCANGLAQEFYGLDDECLLFTVNIGAPDTQGRALALGPGAQDFGPSDAWAGTAVEGTLYRVDGTTGLLKTRADLPAGCHPDGLVIDSSSYLWTAPFGPGSLCWLDPRNPNISGRIREPPGFPLEARVIVADRDQNLWIADRTGAGAYRYAPDRSAGSTRFGDGFWTHIGDAGKAAGATGPAVGLDVDSRAPKAYFAWLALESGWLVQLPAKAIPVQNMDQEIDGTKYPALHLPGFTPIAAGVTSGAACSTSGQNVWVLSRAPSAVILVPVDQLGQMTPPDLASPPKGQDRCAAGDRCILKDSPDSEPGTDSYSAFHGYALRNFCSPKGFYEYVVDGCLDRPTTWESVTWKGDVPLNTVLTLRARAGDTPMPDQFWGAWTPDFQVSPADLLSGMPLFPNSGKYLQLEFDLFTQVKGARPTLESFEVVYRCTPPI